MAEPSYPIKKHRAPAPPVATFGDLLRGGGKWAWLYCNSINCSHRVALAFGPFAIRRGLDTPATTIIRERFRCGRCGAKTSTLTLPSVVVKTGRLQKFPPEHALKLLPAHAWLDAMCNLYSLNGTRDEIGKYLKVSHNRMASFEPQLTLFPGSAAPVVRLANDGERELVNLSWGFVLLMDGKAPRRVTNVRDDKIQNSSFWKGSFEERRCLVPATSFSEPKGLKPATWYWFALAGDVPRPPFAFAGVWRKYKGPLKKDGETVETDVFAFTTTTPNKLVATISHDRMPVILTKEEEFETWLKGSPHEAYSLVREYPADQMRIVQQGSDKVDKLET
jgi:putative SOS response-associated peptidase YedK